MGIVDEALSGGIVDEALTRPKQDTAQGGKKGIKESIKTYMDRVLHPTSRGASNYPDDPVSTRESVARSMPYLGPTMEMGGALAGAMVGGIPGAGVGYATAKQGSDLLNEYTGVKPQEDLKSRAVDFAKDTAVGAAMETGGLAIGRGLQMAGKAIAKSNIPSRIYESAMKISPSVDEATRRAVVNSGLEGGYSVGQRGLTKLYNDIDAVNKEISSVIAKGQKTPINLDKALTRLDDLKSFYEDLPNPKSYLDEIDSIKSDALQWNGKVIPADKAQRMKQAIYRLNRKHYGELKSLNIEANKTIARGLKEELVDAFPELSKLNAKDSSMLQLDEFLERAVHRSRNYEIIKLKDAVLASGGAVLGGKTGMITSGMLNEIIDNPYFKSKLAIALSKAGKKPATKIGRAITYPTIGSGYSGEW